ncbi:MAG: hypothetical protein ACK4SL_01825 [Candidatus Paceibacteria bacterium]
MKQLPANTSSSPPGTPLLYRLVFERALVRVFVVVLVCSFLLQTIERAYASEPVPEPAPDLKVTITDETVATIQHEISERTETTPEPVAEVEVAQSDTSPDGDVVAPEVPPVTPELPNESPPPQDPPPLDPAPDTSGDGEVVVPEEVALASDATTTIEEIATSTATTTDPNAPTLTVESDQMIQFNKDNCLAVEDGSFYCQVATTTPVSDEQGLFSLPDSDGDLEIYIKNKNGMQQITFNTVDDASPYYDPASDSLVWHRLIDERYQIMVYDMASGEEQQLTNTSTNNMEPFRADNIIVWQYWDNDAWQIMLFDGETANQLTNTSEHNLAPVVRNNLVVWHRVHYNEKTIEVYDLNSRAFMTIRDDNGGTISNPRMVLVYDAAMDSGETITRGYDLVTGEITSFAAEPAPLPEEIPDPDTTGEPRALLTAKSTTEEEALEGAPPSDTNASSTPPDLELDLATTTVSTASTTGLTLDLTLIKESTIIEPQPGPTAEIPDLVVTPFTPNASPTVIPVVE